MLLCTAFTTHCASVKLLVVGLYFDANVVHISNILFFYCVKINGKWLPIL